MFPKLTVAFLLMVSLQRGGGGGGGQGFGPPPGDPTQFELLAKKLKLDERKQLPDVQRLFSSIATEAVPLAEEMMQQRLRMLQVIDDGPALRSASDAYSSLAARMVTVEIRAFDELRPLLKPNQLSNTVEAFELMAGLFHPVASGSGGGRRPGGGAPSFEAALQRGGGGGTGGGTGTGGGRRGGGAGGMGGFSAPSRMLTLTLMLSLTEEQKKSVKKLMDDEYRAAEPLRKALTTTREPIGIAIRDRAEGPVINQTVSAYAMAVTAMAVHEMKALARIVALVPQDAGAGPAAIQPLASTMRGAFVGKKWDMAPDLRSY